MGCRAGVIVCGLAATAFADELPEPQPAPPQPQPAPQLEQLPTTITPRPAPPEVSWYATVAPAAAPAPNETARPYRYRVGRGGVFLLAGVTHIGAATRGRVDIGVPTPLRRARRLRSVVITEVGDPSTEAVERRDLAITPELQYDWRLFGIASGDVVLIAGIGIQWARTWVRLPDEPFWPSSWESTTGFSGRLDAAFQYRGAQGFVVSLHPVSAILPIGNPEPPDARWMPEEPKAQYGVSLVAGYQFR